MLELTKRLDLLPPRHPERVKMIQTFSDLYAVSVGSVYRALRAKRTPKSMRRAYWGCNAAFPQTMQDRLFRSFFTTHRTISTVYYTSILRRLIPRLDKNNFWDNSLATFFSHLLLPSQGLLKTPLNLPCCTFRGDGQETPTYCSPPK